MVVSLAQPFTNKNNKKSAKLGGNIQHVTLAILKIEESDLDNHKKKISTLSVSQINMHDTQRNMATVLALGHVVYTILS